MLSTKYIWLDESESLGKAVGLKSHEKMVYKRVLGRSTDK
jgi:hypothetical protein